MPNCNKCKCDRITKSPRIHCHTFSSDGRCVSLLKILFSNDCVFDCKYCPSRAANEKERATFTPEEICRLVVEFYRRNYIEGLFLSSAVVKSPAYTMERMYEAIYMLRNKYHFNGYIHVKAIPGAPDDMISVSYTHLTLPTNSLV